MLAKYILPILIVSTILFWILAILIPTQGSLFILLRNVFFGISLLYGGILIGIAHRILNANKNVEYKHLEKEKFVVTLTDGVQLHGEILFSAKTDDNSPVVLACHGWLGNFEALYPTVYPLVLQGYKVVCYNHRGHGLKPYLSGGNKSEIDKTFMDVQQVIDFIEKRPDLNHEKLGAIGFSLGGYTLLTGGYLDLRLKLVIACCTGHRWTQHQEFWAWYVHLFFKISRLPIAVSEELNQKLSPKYYLSKKMDKVVCLISTKNDRIVSYDGFLKNKEMLNLPEDQVLDFETGDHGFFGQSTVLVSQIIKWLKDYL